MSHFQVWLLTPHVAERRYVREYADDIASLLDRYDENRRVDPYRVPLEAYSLELMRSHYRIPDTEPVDSLLPHMQEWCGCDGVVIDGVLHRITTYNPDSKWDWYEIGGRWNRELPNGQNIMVVTQLPHEWKPPFAIVTKNGEWHERARMLYFGLTTDEQDQGQWRNECSEILSGHTDCVIINIDAHI